MNISVLTISSKGQIALPKKIRDLLDTNIISLSINEHNQVLINPIHEVGGSLSSYQQHPMPSFEEVREQSWREAISAKELSNGEEK